LSCIAQNEMNLSDNRNKNEKIVEAIIVLSEMSIY